MSKENIEQKNGIYLDGKNQVIELLRNLAIKDKSTLLKNIKLRNPALAKELSEQCFAYHNIWDFDDETLETIFQNVKPMVIGLALNLSPSKQQKRALSLIQREKAIQAYEIMTKDLSSHRHECLKAQDKILEVTLELGRRRVINCF